MEDERFSSVPETALLQQFARGTADARLATGQDISVPTAGPSLAPLLSPARAPLSTLTQAPAGPSHSWTREAWLERLISLEDSSTRPLVVKSFKIDLYLLGCPSSPVNVVIDSGAEMCTIGENHWLDWKYRCSLNLQDRWESNPPVKGYGSPGGRGRVLGMAKNVPLFARPDMDGLMLVDVLVLSGPQDSVLLGMPFFARHGVVPVPEPGGWTIHFKAQTLESGWTQKADFAIRHPLNTMAWAENKQYYCVS